MLLGLMGATAITGLPEALLVTQAFHRQQAVTRSGLRSYCAFSITWPRQYSVSSLDFLNYGIDRLSRSNGTISE